MAGQATEPVAQFRQIASRVLIQIHRMQAKGGVQLWIALDQRPQTLPMALIDPQYHHSPDALLSTAREHLRAVGLEVGKIQVGMAVDQLHAHASRMRCLNVRATACTPGL